MDDFLPPWYDEIDCFLKFFEQEVESSPYLRGRERVALDRYCRRLPHGSSDRYARLGFIRAWSRRMTPVLDRIETAPPAFRILDAGCGVGTQALLFACHGAEVLGVDINSDRLSVAQQRPGFYKEKGLLTGSVRFVLKNIFSVLEQEAQRFDLIWASEAISHIDPLDSFLDLAYGALQSGGCIVISDPNNLNPWVWVKLFRRRGLRLYTRKIDPETGEMISYARERCFSIAQISSRLESAGFGVERVIAGSYIPGFLRSSSLYLDLLSIEETIKQLPMMDHLSGGYTVVGTKSLNA